MNRGKIPLIMCDRVADLYFIPSSLICSFNDTGKLRFMWKVILFMFTVTQIEREQEGVKMTLIKTVSTGDN